MIPLTDTPIYAQLKVEHAMREKIHNLNANYDGAAIMRDMLAIEAAGKALPRVTPIHNGRKPR